MANLTPEEEEKRLRAIQEQNEAAKDLLSTYEKIRKVRGSLSSDEKDSLNIAKDILKYSSVLEKHIQHRLNNSSSIRTLNKAINELEKEHGKIISNSGTAITKLNSEKQKALILARQEATNERNIQASINRELQNQGDIQFRIDTLSRSRAAGAAAQLRIERQNLRDSNSALSILEKSLKKTIERKEEQKRLVSQVRNTIDAHQQLIHELEEEIKYSKERIETEKLIHKNLGITGQLFKSIAKTLQKFGIPSETIEDINTKLRKAAENGKVSFGQMSKIVKEGLREAMQDPVNRFLVGLTLVKSAFNDIKKAFGIFKEYDSILTGTARALGQTTDQVKEMTRNAHESQKAFGSNVYSAKQIGEAISGLNEGLGLSVGISGQTANEFAAMTNQMGLTATEATNIYELGKLNNLSLRDTNKQISAGIVAAQKSTGVQVNARQVFQEIGKLSAGITAKFNQNPKLLAEAVAQAKALGTNLEQVDKIGESLLNWESSIENELKAELITGKQINLERARYAALTGNQVDLMKEIADQVGTLEDFNNMNVISQKSLAEAFGMSRNELAEMLQKQEVFNKLGDVSGKSAAEQLKIARERGLSESDSLLVNLKQQTAAENLAVAFDNIKMAVAGLLEGPFGLLVDGMQFIAKNSWAAYTAMSLLGAISIAKLIGGLAMMATSLGMSAASALMTMGALTLGVGIAIAVASMMAAKESTKTAASDLSKPPQGVADGVALANRGPFEITDRFGAKAITKEGDNMAVSPNMTISPKSPTNIENDNISIAAPKPPLVVQSSPQQNTFSEQTMLKFADKIASEISKKPIRSYIDGKEAFANDLGSTSDFGTAQAKNTRYRVA